VDPVRRRGMSPGQGTRSSKRVTPGMATRTEGRITSRDGSREAGCGTGQCWRRTSRSAGGSSRGPDSPSTPRPRPATWPWRPWSPTPARSPTTCGPASAHSPLFEEPGRALRILRDDVVAGARGHADPW